MTARQRDELEAAARRLHAEGRAATSGGRPAEGARTLRAALELLAAAGPDGVVRSVRGRILLSLAHAEAEQGHVDRGLLLLDEAAALLDNQAVVHGQRGLFLARTGRTEAALAELDRAVQALHPDGDPVELSRVLLNRGYTRLMAGERKHSRADLVTSARLARGHQQHHLAIKATQNLGFFEFLAGNLPDALRLLDVAVRECAEHLPSYLPVIAVDKARVLLAAGLVADAGCELDQAIAAFRRRRLSEDHAGAALTRASVALLAGEPDLAERWAATARRHFLARGNQTGAELAALARLWADFARAAPPLPLARRGVRIAARLAELGLANDGRMAALLAVRAYLRAGAPAKAVAGAERVRAPRPGDPLDLRLLWHIAYAELAAERGDIRRQSDHLRAGLARLHQHRSLLGSADLQSGVAIHGRELAAAGLTMALDSGRVGRVFEWTELIRAQAFRLPPVRPPDDPEAALALGELRRLMVMSQQPDRRGESAGQLRARRAELERTVRERAWFRTGTGVTTPVATMPAVLDRLGDDTMIIYLGSRHRLGALVLGRGTARLAWLGDQAQIDGWLRRLHVDLDTLAARAVPGRMMDTLVRATRHDSQGLADLLVGPLLAEAGDRKVVVVPTGALFTVPWLQLPPLRGRPVVVTPSATAWLTAGSRAVDGGLEAVRPAVLVAGPDIDHGDREISSIAEVLPGAVRLTGSAATPAATLGCLDGTPLAHIAAHGHHESGNALFSSLDLAGGALMGYDIQQLRQPPRHVVLSACELGWSSVRTGDEIVGMVAVLLATGSTTVIASVGRVTDSSAPDVMIPYHRQVAGGAAPAEALAVVTELSPHASFVCFGSG
ncbi:MAG TPA: CHAT domain-containing protein [Mycobacteriales bacterium]|nr:CHAT domain-containing protein [Mycobacteriales bacterium]